MPAGSDATPRCDVRYVPAAALMRAASAPRAPGTNGCPLTATRPSVLPVASA